MEGTRKEQLVEGCGDLSDLSTQLSGQQWRWDRRSARDHSETGLFKRAGNRCDLAVSGLQIPAG